MLLLATLALCVAAAGVAHSQPPAVTPDLHIFKSHSAPSFFQGQVGATYTINVKNDGSGPTDGTGVTVNDFPNPGLFATGATGTGWNCTPSSGNVSCTRSDVLAGGGAAYPTITVTVNVADNAGNTTGGVVTNFASVSGGGELLVDQGDNSASDPTVIDGRPDVSIAKSHTDPFFQGQVGATYTIKVKNIGGAATSGTVTVTDTLPAGLTPTAAGDPPGNTWTCSIASQTVTCTRSDALASGASYPDITLTVNVANNAPAIVTNRATVSGGGEIDDPNAPGVETDQNTFNDPTNITGVPHVSIAKTHTGDFIQGQVGAIYTITVTNIGGAATTTAVTVTDTVPTGLTPISAAGTNWSCNIASQTVTCTYNGPPIGANGGTAPPITLTVNVAEDASPTVTNEADVSGGVGDSPSIETDHTAYDYTRIFQKHDTFQVNYFAGANGARPDQTVRITNPGTAHTVICDGMGWDACDQNLDPGTPLDICANIYVFRNDQQLAECCSCLITPNGLRTLSVDFDLAHDPLTPGAVGEGVIKIVSSSATSDGGTCPLHPVPNVGGTKAGTHYLPLPALRAWGTHNQDVSGGLQGSAINQVTETHFLFATLSEAELRELQDNCAFIQSQGSGHGICSCGRGD
jgi:uncharacterized repeat protein (TIGR01451 family)